ncbi:MAG: response regulator transcription factor [Pleurocapsa sp. MO_192.B19]|nr:response regulator transcription factor [Pleurocapsa sp. MO_192.B19]
MISTHISIVESNPHLRSLLGWHLQQSGYAVSQSASLQQGRDAFYRHQPVLVIIDSDLPDGDGLELSRWLYEQQKSLILLLSARSSEQDIVRGLKTGADDYLTKPFGMHEFLARVEALIRRMRIINSTPLSVNCKELKIDLAQRRVQVKGDFIELTPQEFSLLYVLAQAEGTPLSRSELLKRAWPDAIDNPRTVDTHVLSLRKKIESNPRQPNIIQTVRNIGYCFNPELIEDRQNLLKTDLISQNTPNMTCMSSRI